jgi:Mg-chelatase subunit ChlD
VSSRTPRFLACALACGGLAGLAAPAAHAEGSSVRILIDAPKPGEKVQNKVHQAPVRGTAVATGERPALFDVMLVLDISGSTKAASGVDVDRDGETGINPQFELLPSGTYPEGTLSTDPGDSILSAEVAAADALIASLERGGRIRIGIITFSGDMNDAGLRRSYDQQDAHVEVPLTSDFDAARSQLPKILARGPYGGTNFAAGLRLAIGELAGLSGSKSQSRPDARRIVLFLTDGLPTFPIGVGSVSDPGDVEAALTAARLAHKASITINSYALGPQALTNPFAATEIARITLGNFLPVQNPGNIVSFLQGVSFANVDDVVLTNLTTKEVSYDVSLNPDGTFSGFVPVREGRNQVRVTALASDGSQSSVDLDLDFETAGMTERELALELERVRERNKQLMLLVERERIQRFRERQRKEIQIEAGEEESPKP